MPNPKAGGCCKPRPSRGVNFTWPFPPPGDTENSKRRNNRGGLGCERLQQGLSRPHGSYHRTLSCRREVAGSVPTVRRFTAPVPVLRSGSRIRPASQRMLSPPARAGPGSHPRCVRRATRAAGETLCKRNVSSPPSTGKALRPQHSPGKSPERKPDAEQMGIALTGWQRNRRHPPAALQVHNADSKEGETAFWKGQRFPFHKS